MDRREPAILDTTSPGAHTQSIDPSPPAGGIAFGDNPPIAPWTVNAQRAAEAAKWRTPPYDPVAVLEAMRERGHEVYVCCHGEWFAEFPGVHDSSTGYPGYQYSPAFPDFPSAVRWLHRQAAAVDPAFAEQWPVPE